MKYDCAYKDVSMAAMTYSLMCFRMAEGEKFPTDIATLVSLGEKLTNLDFEFKWDQSGDRASRLVDTIGARYLACKLEDALLNGSEEEFSSKKTERLRVLGVNTLGKMGKILKRASKPEFREYAPALDEFFKEWEEWADEFYVTDSPPGPKIIFYIFSRADPAAA